MATVFNELPHDGAFIISTANGTRATDQAVIYNAGSAPLAFSGGLVLSAGSNGYVPYTGDAAAEAILYGRVTVPAAGSARATIVHRDAEVQAAALLWDPAVTDAKKLTAKSDLEKRGILLR
ncbi:Hypothetical protein GbCGDNIH3_7063 [Granulibacter bethesdensis]|uniref:Phage protein n=1 Tax=Granulibacter bethesdensis TaxID=364410 RepID=A0AAN0VG50_9PROT|nr:head decoration protein [Granulibacter bethesdensis]AHJ63245.1 Hypothetical protein GbCGDNIH3_7063 [Granulibacter bethesdensis]